MTAVDYRKNFGLVLKGIRKSYEPEVSQEDFADKLGINRTYYGNVERGENSISMDKLQQIAEALETPLSHLMKKASKLFSV